jgi:putative ABC transport system permease protein
MNEVFGIPADTLLIALLVASALIVALVAVSAWLYPLPFRLGLRNLPRRRAQTALVIGGLALSTMIITSALGIGDTIDYSTKAGVYDSLGTVDVQIGTGAAATAGGSFFRSAPERSDDGAGWFDAAVAGDVAGLVDGVTIDGLAAVVIQTLPVASTASSLSEAGAQVRGVYVLAGDGLALPEGLAALGAGEVLVNASLARELDISPGDTLLLVKGMPAPVEVAGIVPDGGLSGATPAVLAPLAWVQDFFGRDGEINALLVSNAGDAETGATLTARAVALLDPVVASAGLVVSPIKADGLEAAASGAEFITTLFITFGTFSILAGVLLIFLIFTVLAAERRSELGMSRAVGQQRADLVRQFVTEGLAYNLIAAAIGAALGVGAALLLAGTLLDLLVGAGTLDIRPRVTLRSVAIGYTLGLVITFVTVGLSAVRISKVNIISAIRDLDLPSLPRPSQWTLFLHPFRVYRETLRAVGGRHYGQALRLFLLGAPRAIWNFWMGLLARGPLLLVLGYLMAWVGVNLAGQAGVYGLGVALFFVGLGQLAAWLGLSQRLAYSLTGLALVLYWILPTREVGALAELGTNPGDFFIGGLFMVGGAIMLFLYNADELLSLFAGALGRLGRLLPVVRVAIAYPVAARGRTATTLAMFSLVVFTLVGTATISNTFSNFLDVESGSGGYDVLVQANPFNPITEEALVDEIDERVAAGDMARPEALVPVVFGPVEGQAPGMERGASYAINGVDAAFFTTQRLELSTWAAGYDSAAAVWSALESDPTLAVIDNFSIDRSGDPTFQADNGAFFVRDISASADSFQPVTIRLAGSDGTEREFTVIGVLGSAPTFYGATVNAEAAATLGYEAPSRYLLRLPEGADARAAANAVEGAFSRSGLQTSLPKEELAESRSSLLSVFYLLQGFMGLGLLVGIAALGVITIRAVVERRQQIGVLRAIGFHRDMVQAVFLVENLFVSGLGTFIGYALALGFAYNLYLQVAADQGLPFLPPWPLLIGIGAALLAATLFTAWLHARQAARVVIAEALRYKG